MVTLLMNSEDEILLYLAHLLDHRFTCESDVCPSCLSLQGIVENIRSHMFSGPVFPDIMIGVRHVPAAAGASSGQAAVQKSALRTLRGRISKSNRDVPYPV